MGECWHNWGWWFDLDNETQQCRKCSRVEPLNPKYKECAEGKHDVVFQFPDAFYKKCTVCGSRVEEVSNEEREEFYKLPYEERRRLCKV